MSAGYDQDTSGRKSKQQNQQTYENVWAVIISVALNPYSNFSLQPNLIFIY
jgi:hypothetical protein